MLKPGSRVNPALQEMEAPTTQAFVLFFFFFWYTQCYLPPNSEPRLLQVPYLVLRLRVAAVMVSTATLGLDPFGFPLWEVAAASTPASSHRLRMGRGSGEQDFSVEVGMPLDRAQLTAATHTPATHFLLCSPG